MITKNYFLQDFFTPRLDGRALDYIKIIAAFFMVLDHINSMLLDGGQLWMFLLGRSVFPIFCYAVAMALYKSSDQASRYGLAKYMPRLLLLAVLSEPISLYARDTGLLNVLFTLALGAGFAALALRMKDTWVYLCFTLALLSQPFWAGVVEFNLAGIALPAAFLMTMQGKKPAAWFLLGLLVMANLSDLAKEITQAADYTTIILGVVLCALGTTLIPAGIFHLAREWPQDGRCLHKYALHLFYPGHLLLIFLFGAFFMGR